MMIIFRFVGNFHRYFSSESTTYEPNNKTFKISYGDGSGAQGFYSIDTVTVSLKN
jgi:hypothetical protein